MTVVIVWILAAYLKKQRKSERETERGRDKGGKYYPEECLIKRYKNDPF